MNWFRRLRARAAVDRDLREEIAQHLAEREDELVRDGLAAEEASRQARREFGNATQIAEHGRDVWRLVFIEGTELRVGCSFEIGVPLAGVRFVHQRGWAIL